MKKKSILIFHTNSNVFMELLSKPLNHQIKYTCTKSMHIIKAREPNKTNQDRCAINSKFLLYFVVFVFIQLWQCVFISILRLSQLMNNTCMNRNCMTAKEAHGKKTCC